MDRVRVTCKDYRKGFGFEFKCKFRVIDKVGEMVMGQNQYSYV